MGIDRNLHIGPAVFCRRNGRKVNTFAVSEKIGEMLSCLHNMGSPLVSDTDIWIGNRTDDGLARFGEEVAEMSPAALAAEMLKFGFYADAIQVLSDRYGRDNVRLAFAVVPYCS